MIRLKKLKLLGLMTLLLNGHVYAIDANKEKDITKMLENFLNLSFETNKPFETWIDDLTKVIGNEKEFEKFKSLLETLRREKNVRIAQLKLVQNQKLAPLFVQQILKQKTTPELSNILTRRMQAR